MTDAQQKSSEQDREAAVWFADDVRDGTVNVEALARFLDYIGGGK